MKEQIKFEELTDDEKKVLLSAFDYEVDKEGNIIDALLKEKIISEITRQPLTLKSAALITGSLKIIDSNPLSISRYLREETEKNDS